MTQNGTITSYGPERLSRKQLIALEALATRSAEESMEEVAQRAGMSRSTLYRLLKNDTFYYALQLRVRDLSRSYMGAVMHGLARSAAKGDAGCQRIYWQLAGKLQESIEVTRERRGIETPTIDPEKFTPDFRAELLRQIRGGVKEITLADNADNADNADDDIPDVPRPRYTDIPADNLDLYNEEVRAVEAIPANIPANTSDDLTSKSPRTVADVLNRLSARHQ